MVTSESNKEFGGIYCRRNPFLKYLCRIATSYAAIANRPYAYALALCLRRVSFAIQKGLAYQLTSSPSFIPTITKDVFDLS
jgi:hypothetical protein